MDLKKKKKSIVSVGFRKKLNSVQPRNAACLSQHPLGTQLQFVLGALSGLQHLSSSAWKEEGCAGAAQCPVMPVGAASRAAWAAGEEGGGVLCSLL